MNRITRLADDLALALAAPSIRVEAPVPGQPIIGLEVPNEETRVVSLRGLLESPEYQAMVQKGGLPIALGRDVRGNAVVTDLAKMPHVLIAGATGSGKSVCINTIICCLLMYQSPEKLRLILVDPKRVELTSYGAAPHLAFSHVVTEPDEVVGVLGVVVAEMERRYKRLETCGARNLAAYNALPTTERQMPYWVVVLDELADMMMAAPVDVGAADRAFGAAGAGVGIHLVVATQRPSVDVVTGLIKANFPSRIGVCDDVADRRAGDYGSGRRGEAAGPRGHAVDDVGFDQGAPGAGRLRIGREIERLIEAWSPPTAAEEEERPTLDEMLGELSENPRRRRWSCRRARRRRNCRRWSRPWKRRWRRTRTMMRQRRMKRKNQTSCWRRNRPQRRKSRSCRRRPRRIRGWRRRRSWRATMSASPRRCCSDGMRIGQPRAERLIDALEQRGVVAESRRAARRAGCWSGRADRLIGSGPLTSLRLPAPSFPLPTPLFPRRRDDGNKRNDEADARWRGRCRRNAPLREQGFSSGAGCRTERPAP